MNTIKICGLTLFLLVGISVFSGIYINMSCNKIIDKIEQIDVSSHRNDMESAAKTASELMDEWEKFNKIASLLIHNDKLTEAQFSLARILPLIESENDELGAELSELKSAVEHISEGEKPILRNIF